MCLQARARSAAKCQVKNFGGSEGIIPAKRAAKLLRTTALLLGWCGVVVGLVVGCDVVVTVYARAVVRSVGQ